MRDAGTRRFILRTNEPETDRLLIRAIWYAYIVTVPLIGGLDLLTAGQGPLQPAVWTGATAACLAVPTLFYRRGWLPGSIKYLGPAAAASALVVLSFTIHQSTSSWTIWLLPTAVASLYFDPRVVWLANGIAWVGAGLAISALPQTFPEATFPSA
jgi:hypothetical protein